MRLRSEVVPPFLRVGEPYNEFLPKGKGNVKRNIFLVAFENLLEYNKRNRRRYKVANDF